MSSLPVSFNGCCRRPLSESALVFDIGDPPTFIFHDITGGILGVSQTGLGVITMIRLYRWHKKRNAIKKNKNRLNCPLRTLHIRFGALLAYNGDSKVWQR